MSETNASNWTGTISFDYVKKRPSVKFPEVERVIFNPPATVVYWADGTKTVVKIMAGDPFDEHVGFQAAVTKKVFGGHIQYKRHISDGYRAGETSAERLLRKVSEREKDGYKTLAVGNFSISTSSLEEAKVELPKTKYKVSFKKVEKGVFNIFVDWRKDPDDDDGEEE